MTVDEYGVWWLAHRPALRPSTRELYTWLLGRHIRPALGSVVLAELTPMQVRGWHAELSASAAPTPVRQAYTLLRAICTTAVEDGLITANPCRVGGAGKSRQGARSVPTRDQVEAVAGAIWTPYSHLVLVAAWSGLRFGELAALRRDRVDLETGVVRVESQFVELRGCRLLEQPPKSAAGVRAVHLPPHLLPGLAAHLATHVPAGCALVFPNGKGEPLRRSSFRSVWLRARERAGVPALRFHDLRHFASTMAAQAGASTRELMARMGHSTMDAALVYQHAGAERDRAIAQALSGMAES
jgi:integrase